MVDKSKGHNRIVEGMSLGTIVNQMIFISHHCPYVLGERKDLDEHEELICNNYDNLRSELDKREERYLRRYD